MFDCKEKPAVQRGASPDAHKRDCEARTPTYDILVDVILRLCVIECGTSVSPEFFMNLP